MYEKQILKYVPEIVRRNVKQVIQILVTKGFDYQQNLINQYLNGQKSQYQFLLPKSKNYRYYTQQLAKQINENRERKLPPSFFNNNEQKSKRNVKNLVIQGTVEEVSVGAMCELIKQLRQNKQPYEPFENQIYEQQMTIDLDDQNLNKKIQPILEMIQNLKNPLKLKQGIVSPDRINGPTKIDVLRSELGTQKDGSLGRWGGKKYEGLGIRDQFTNYRKQVSKNFYQFNNPR